MLDINSECHCDDFLTFKLISIHVLQDFMSKQIIYDYNSG